MEQEAEIKRLRKELRKRDARIRKLKNGEEIRALYDEIDRIREDNYQRLLWIDSLKKEILLGEEKYKRLEAVHKKLQEKFEVNFGFHGYIRDVLDQTANLMENYNAVRKQGKAVQKRIPAAKGTRRARRSDGTSTRTPCFR
jgi:chromosome segregation ATPase